LFASCWENEGKYKRAIAELQKAIEASGTQSASHLDYLGHAYEALGNRVQAEKILDELDRMSKSAV
jgi:tetratricopeptide (TPR) repeat protein